MSLGFAIENERYVVTKNAKVVAMNLPDYETVAEWVRRGPTVILLDRMFRERLAWLKIAGSYQ